MKRRDAQRIALAGAAQAVRNLVEEAWPYGDPSLTDEDCEKIRHELDVIAARLDARAG